MTGRSTAEIVIVIVGLSAAVASGVIAWKLGGPRGEKFVIDARVKRTVDPKTGEVRSIAFDSNGDLVFDTWSYLERGMQTRMDSDDDYDGSVDRRQYFKADDVLERIEYVDKQGRVTRTEIKESPR